MSFIATIYFFFPDVTPPLSVEEESKPTEINVVNSGKRKMFNDCDHTCSKAIGFSCPGVVLHCSECESEKKLRTLVKKQCIFFYFANNQGRRAQKLVQLFNLNNNFYCFATIGCSV